MKNEENDHQDCKRAHGPRPAMTSGTGRYGRGTPIRVLCLGCVYTAALVFCSCMRSRLHGFGLTVFCFFSRGLSPLFPLSLEHARVSGLLTSDAATGKKP